MNIPLIMTLVGIMLFAHWLSYIMGNPLADKIDARAILFAFPLSLAKRRLKKQDQLAKIMNGLANEIMMTSDPKMKRKLQTDQREEIFLAGREFFTWEKSLLCPICFHWWATIFIGVFLLTFDIINARADFFLAVFTYLFTHFLIRKI